MKIKLNILMKSDEIMRRRVALTSLILISIVQVKSKGVVKDNIIKHLLNMSRFRFDHVYFGVKNSR